MTRTTHRQNTRVIVMVHSHQKLVGNGVVDCSPDVTDLHTMKALKGSGGASFTLVPRQNYFNLIFPNDVVNIYIDPGDGERGFIRTFFGYVDRISRVESVGDQGQVTTDFHVTCTDFVKAIDKTDIYFNPAFAARKDLVGAFGQSQLGGGHALRTSGIVAHGTPAQFVENLLQLLLGFGEQWVMPASYNTTSSFLTTSRQKRQQRAKAMLPDDVKDQLRAAFDVEVESIGLDKDVEDMIVSKQIDVAKELGLAQGDGSVPTDLTGANPNTYTAQQAALSKLFSSKFQLQAYQTILRETQGSSPFSLLDVLSFDFIEAMTIDGFISSSSIWTNQGSLASFLYGWSNEIVNELCFDLRPVAAVGDDQCFGYGYSTESDELGINVNGTDSQKATVPGVQYVPAVVLREYPHATVEGLDLSKFYILGEPAGFQAFGPVFSMGAGGKTNRRVIYNYQTAGIDSLAPEGCTYAEGAKPQKHLDVVKIWSSDTTGSDIARSDSDIFNLFELYAASPRPEMWKYLLSEIVPIVTPVSVKRNGLRVKQLTTKFANYARDQLCHTGGSGVDNGNIRRNLVRWALLLDHWYQHNPEYLNGTINLRGMPEIRVGYRLDWVDRNESYYVEQVSHQWSIPGVLRTTVQVSRGQRNDPFLAYIPPQLARTNDEVAPGANRSADALRGTPTPFQTPERQADTQQQLNKQVGTVQQAGGGDRGEKGRLGTFFPVMDTPATSHATHYGKQGASNPFTENETDKPENIPGYAVFPGDTARDSSSLDPGRIVEDSAIPTMSSDDESLV